MSHARCGSHCQASQSETGGLKPDLATSGKMRISLESRGLVVSLRQATFFPSGEDTIDPTETARFKMVRKSLENWLTPVKASGVSPKSGSSLDLLAQSARTLAA